MMYKRAVFAFISINVIIEPNESIQGRNLNGNYIMGHNL